MPTERRVYRVSELNRKARLKLERWGEVWVEAELRDVKRAGSGHLYLTLDDGEESAQLKAVMYRSDARFARARLADGERVRVLGRFSLYEPRGSFQFVISVALSAGEGDRRREFEKLRLKLQKEGLFRSERKRALPRLPAVVGVVTSRDGAALHDIVRVARGRAPVRLLLSHCSVQGVEAPDAIVGALRRLYRSKKVEVVIVARGGGASEDLLAFNDERVVRAVVASPVPVVSGVGHEVDETLVDLVADRRAATPSNAAEIVVADAEAMSSEVRQAFRALSRAMESAQGRRALALERVIGRLRSSARRLGANWQTQRTSVARAARRSIAANRSSLSDLTKRLVRVDPRGSLARDRATLAGYQRSLIRTGLSLSVAPRAALAQHKSALRGQVRRGTSVGRSELGTLAAQLSALSPLAVLARGYAIAFSEGGQALVRSRDVEPGASIEVRLSEGALRARVEDVEEGS